MLFSWRELAGHVMHLLCSVLQASLGHTALSLMTLKTLCPTPSLAYCLYIRPVLPLLLGARVMLCTRLAHRAAWLGGPTANHQMTADLSPVSKPLLRSYCWLRTCQTMQIHSNGTGSQIFWVRSTLPIALPTHPHGLQRVAP